MIEQFKNLSTQEITLLREAVAMITVLIAGADGEIDAKETSWAKKVTEIRTYNNPDILNDYYKMVAETYSADLHRYIEMLEGDIEKRTQILSEKLAGLNEIFDKIDQDLAVQLYTSFKTFANHVARASGGFLGIGSISYEEQSLVNLPMLRDITPYGDEDEQGFEDEDSNDSSFN